MTTLSKNNAKKGFIFVCLCIVLLLIYGIVRIYALFHSELYAKVKLKNGTWNILVNSTDITKGTDVEFNIDNVQIQENEHVKPGNLAPGLIGNFKISINPTDTDVSVRYDINLNEEKLTNNNIQIKSIKETFQGKELIQVAPNTYAGVITLEEIKAKKINEVTVEIEWSANDNNNEQDVNLGATWNNECQVPINVHVSQYLGEEINPYNKS